LKREPDREGRAHYRQLARKGVTRPNIVRRLMHSREYKASSVHMAGLAVEEFVSRAYQDILGRWPDQDGLDTYRRIASKPNGRSRVLADLRASSEAVRKSGGRLAKIEVLHNYAKAEWPVRLPIVGAWFASRRRLRQRLDKLALNQYLVVQQIVSLREQVEAASLFGDEPFGFADELSGGGDGQVGSKATAIFHNALTRARRGA
jgi:hypothetical protein